jgi:hypothetical protein
MIKTLLVQVKRQVEAGADLIKVYGWISKEVMIP